MGGHFTRISLPFWKSNSASIFARIYAGLDETQKTNKTGVNTVFAMMKNLFATKNWNED